MALPKNAAASLGQPYGTLTENTSTSDPKNQPSNMKINELFDVEFDPNDLDGNTVLKFNAATNKFEIYDITGIGSTGAIAALYVSPPSVTASTDTLIVASEGDFMRADTTTGGATAVELPLISALTGSRTVTVSRVGATGVAVRSPNWRTDLLNGSTGAVYTLIGATNAAQFIAIASNEWITTGSNSNQ